MAAPVKEREQETGSAAEYSEAVQFSAQYISVNSASADTADEPSGQETADTINEAIPAADYMEQAELAQEEMTRRDREILAVLDEVLRKNTNETKQERKHSKHNFDLGRILTCTTEKGAGMLAFALSLVFLGITVMCVMISGSGDYMLIAKLSPVAAVFLGLEIILGWFMPGKKLRVNLPCVVLILLVVVGCCVLAASLNRSYTEIREERSGIIAADEIYEKSYTTLRHSADILTLSVEVIPSPENDGTGMLADGDKVNITAEFDGSYNDPEEFAQECRNVMDVYDALDISVMNYYFSAETRLKNFRLNVEGLFQQDKNTAELSDMVDYFYIEDYDYISDIEDVIEEESAEA